MNNTDDGSDGELYECDQCGRTIVSNVTRYHCVDCDDYDLCAPCFQDSISTANTTKRPTTTTTMTTNDKNDGNSITIQANSIHHPHSNWRKYPPDADDDDDDNEDNAEDADDDDDEDDDDADSLGYKIKSRRRNSRLTAGADQDRSNIDSKSNDEVIIVTEAVVSAFRTNTLQEERGGIIRSK